MKKIFLKIVELIPFFSIFILIGFIGYSQFKQSRQLDTIQLQFYQSKIQLEKLLAGQKENKQMQQQTDTRISALVESSSKNNAPAADTAMLEFENIETPQITHQTLIQTSNKTIATTTTSELKIPPENHLISNSQPDKTLSETQQVEANYSKQQNIVENDILDQLTICKEHLDAYRLTRGSNGNAYDCYLSILKKQPENKQAIAGIYKIEKNYVRSINKYINKENYAKAKLFLTSLIQINPNNKNISSFESQLKVTPSKTINKPETATIKQKKKLKSTPILAKDITNKALNNYIKISPGCFTSDTKTKCIHEGFFISKFEVTQKQWQAVMGNNPSRFKDCGSDCPVENISWFEIQDFIRKLNNKTGKNYRLPTDVEWEYATRAGSDDDFYFGNDSRQLSLYANYCDKQCANEWKDIKHDDGAATTKTVGSYKPNAWGLYDTHGNVWEWVDVKNAEKQVYRGGSWGDNYKLCQSSSKGEAKPDFRVSGIGFRLAHD